MKKVLAWVLPVLILGQARAATRVNFQPSSAPPAAGCLTDCGAVYGVRAGGNAYGWSRPHATYRRGLNADPTLDTVCVVEKGAIWEMAVSNGQYAVTASVGDAAEPCTNSVNVEGIACWDSLVRPANTFTNRTVTVTVTDGRLTLDQGPAAAFRTRLNWLEFSCTGGGELPGVDDLPACTNLPPLLTMLDGSPVDTLDDWINRRRPELKRLLQHYVFGYLPVRPPVEHTIAKTRTDAFGGAATYKEVDLCCTLPNGNTLPIHVALFVPNGGAPKPVILALIGSPNHCMTTYDEITVRDYPGCSAARGQCEANYICNAEYVVRRGFALAFFNSADLDPDNDDFSNGVHALYSPCQPGDPDHQWRTIGAWAWGMHRVVDYLEGDPDIDNERIAVTGFSRRGKTALLAAALDERIDLVWPHGPGGADRAEGTLSPDNPFLYWYCRGFTNFVGRDNTLPIEVNGLVSLVAPRPYLDAGGDSEIDGHQNESMNACMADADRVYALYGRPGVTGAWRAASIPADYPGAAFQLILSNKGHYVDIEFWEPAMDFCQLQFAGHVTPSPYAWYGYEAESAQTRQGCTVAAAVPRYTGSGYVTGLDQPGDYIEWTHVVPGAGVHDLAVRAGCQSNPNEYEIDVAVNGVPVKTDHDLFNWNTRNWFVDFRIKAAFEAGNNTVRITKKDAGNLNIDYMAVVRDFGDEPVPIPRLALSTNRIAVACTQGRNAPNRTFEVWNAGTGSLCYDVSETSSRLSVAPLSGVSTGSADRRTHAVAFTTGELEPGLYERVIRVAAAPGLRTADSPQEVRVLITVTPPVPPDAPGDLSAVARSATEVQLTWTDNSDNEAGFKIDRRQSMTDVWVRIAAPDADMTQYADVGLPAATKFYYVIKAYNTAGNSACSEPAYAATQPAGGPDVDGDSLPDAWEQAVFGSTGVSGPDADTDGDGMSDYAEYVAGCDPTDSSRWFAVDAVLSTGGVLITFLTVAAAGSGYEGLVRHYALEQSSQAVGAVWTVVPGCADIPATGQPATHTPAASAPGLPMLYRAKTWLQSQ
ncbi:MAG: hypothetical protein JXR37_07285 [Kiritimatiellae bacterium]|nr:hypothetical protein [Kiritimatiellia bacterium]